MCIYHRWNVPPIINACGTVTRLGGAPMPPLVLDAMREAAEESVSLEQMQAAAAVHIAELTATESALVTAGSAAALTLGAAAILAGNDLSRIESLPHSDDFPHEFVVAREQRSGYDHAVRAAGAKLVEVGFNEIVAGAGVRRTEAWEYEAAFTPNTAGVLFVEAAHAAPSLRDVVRCAHRHQLPVLVDAAGELPPRENLKRIAESGADLIAFSGGKAIRGPQSTGILCGRRDLISSAAMQMLDMDDHWELWDPPPELIDKSKWQGMPRHGIGRALKVSKEEIVALLTALDLFVSGVYDEQIPQYQKQLEQIRDALTDCAADCRIHPSPDGERYPRLEIQIDEPCLNRTAFEVCRRLRSGSPPIFVGHSQLAQNRLEINPVSLSVEATNILAARLRQELKS